MKILKRIIIGTLILVSFGVFLFIFFLSPLPYFLYNSVINPSGIISKNTLVSYDNFRIDSAFVDSVTLNEFNFSRSTVTKYDSKANKYYPDTEIVKSSVKIGNVSVNNQSAIATYEYPDIIACIENKSGDLIYGLDLCMNNCDNNMNSGFELHSNTNSSFDILASLDGWQYYKNGGYSEVSSYPLVDFSSINLSHIYIYPRTYYKSSKGNISYTCGDFYKNKSNPIKVIEIQ